MLKIVINNHVVKNYSDDALHLLGIDNPHGWMPNKYGDLFESMPVFDSDIIRNVDEITWQTRRLQKQEHIDFSYDIGYFHMKSCGGGAYSIDFCMHNFRDLEENFKIDVPYHNVITAELFCELGNVQNSGLISPPEFIHNIGYDILIDNLRSTPEIK